MSDPDVTRSARLSRTALELRREGAPNERTRLPPPIRLLRGPPSPEAVFNGWQGRMARTAREESRRGVFIFALTGDGDFAGQVWLRADDTPRTTTIGRHSSCELFLPNSDELSLRQLLVIVSGTPLEPRCRLVDLRSTAGFSTSDGEPLSSVLFTGTAVFSLPGYWLVFVPTGQVVQWDERALNAWQTLPKQNLVVGEDWRSADDLMAMMSRGPGSTVATFHAVPSLGGTPLLLAGERPEGILVIDIAGVQRLSVALGGRALDRGIILGRDSRCLGLTTGLPDSLSRVHAIVLREQGDVLIADAGSTNGTWLGEIEIRSAVLQPEQRFRLGGPLHVWWRRAH